MTHQEFSEAVRSLREGGVRLEQWLQVDSAKIVQWESGEKKIPRIRVRQISWLLRDAEDRRRVRDANLPKCELASEIRIRRLSQIAGSPQAALHDAAENYLRELAAHTPTCEVCRSNKQWSKQHLTNGSFPLPGLGGRVLGIMSGVPPRFALPAMGATALGGVVAVQVGLNIIVRLISSPNPSDAFSSVSAGAFGVGAAALVGAAGGLAIPIVRPVFRRLGVVGHCLAWIAMVEAFLFAQTFSSQLAVGEPLLQGLGEWKQMAAFGLVFAILAAFFVRRTEANRKPVTT